VQQVESVTERETLMQGAIAVYILIMRKGSKVDIFHGPENRFYEARVTKVLRNGVNFLYTNTHNEKGNVKFKDILATWRPHLGDDSRIVTELLFIYDRMKTEN
jgi:hypothetical protein